MDCPIETVWRLFVPPTPETRLAWGARLPRFIGGAVAEEVQWRNFAARYGHSNDCYFTPNPVVGEFYRRPSTEHVAFIRCVVIDLDPVQGSISTEPERSIIEHAQDLLGLDLHPDRIDSGRGRQLWLRFEPFPVSTQEEKQRWRGAVGTFLNRLDQNTGIVGGCRIDTSCCDLPRLVRLPGTINTKTGRVAQFLEIGQSDPRVREAILSRFGMESTPQHGTRSNGGSDWRHNAHWLSGRAKWFIYHGVSEPGRHSAAFAAASSMKELGASLEATEAAVLRGAERCSPPLSEYEAKRCVRNAFAKGDGGA